MPLTEENCTACRAGSATINRAQAETLLQQLPGWDILAFDHVEHLVKTFNFNNFVNAMRFTIAVGELAEAANHHPTLITTWGKVTVHWWTHAINGLHRNDFIMAAKTERLFQDILQVQ